MKYLKKFNESFNDIDAICRKYDITNYTINEDGTIDVDDTEIDIASHELIEIPLKFRNVNKFYCYDNQLTSLEGSPVVTSLFSCFNNKLTSLQGCPKYANEGFFCYRNELTSLEGSPKYVGEDFYCFDNKLTSFEGSP